MIDFRAGPERKRIKRDTNQDDPTQRDQFMEWTDRQFSSGTRQSKSRIYPLADLASGVIGN
ncbi:hypothetical protein TWF718_006517 [Orbilia javanica]|uniref:Uncharacterized protein n=1 Tax=Orbilia javanica TaxID=47235 RepID=A0AAN8RED2_9PEZI